MITYHPDLGALKTLEVFDYFDFPRLFGCENRTGQRFLALSVEDSDATHTFIYLPVSNARYTSLSMGELPIYDALKFPEEGIVFRVLIEGDEAHVARIAQSDIPEEWFPEPSVTIQSAEPGAFQPSAIWSAKEVVVFGRREVANVALKYSQGRTDIAARELGNFVNGFQELVDAIAQACDGNPTIKGAIPEKILDQTRLRVTQTYPGSFGVQFAAETRSDLFDDSLLGEAFARLFSLLAAESDEDKISNLLHELHGRAASKYRSLLEVLISTEGDVKLDWGSPKSEHGGELVMSRNSIAGAYRIVSMVEEQIGEEIRVIAKLVGLNARTRSYELFEEANRQKYAGKVGEGAQAAIFHAVINDTYVANLRRVIEVQSTSGEERDRWILMDLNPLERDSQQSAT